MDTNHTQLSGSYDFILPFFKLTDLLRPTMTQLHAENGYVYATDTHMAIRVPESLLIHKYYPVEKYPNVEKILAEAFAHSTNETAILETNDLITVLSRAKWARESEGIACKECEGNGVKTCPYCEHDHTCETCNGRGTTGTVIGEFALLESDSFFKIRIAKKLFNANLLHVIALSARILKADQIEYIHDPESYCGSIFRFAGIDILLMPVLGDEADVEIAVYKREQ